MTSSRIASLDWARSIAILFVVLCHSVEYFHGIAPNSSLSIDVQYSILFAFGRLGVPLFLFLTGALVLRKTIDGQNGDVGKFYKKKLLPLLVTTEIWVVIYFLFSTLMTGVPRFDSLVRQMLFLEYASVANMWYMPMILGIYLAVPFIAVIVKNFNFKTLAVPLCIVFIVGFVLAFCNGIFEIEGMPAGFPTVLDLSFLGGVYGLYLLFGYYMANKQVFQKIPKWALVIVVVVSFAVAVAVQCFFLQEGDVFPIWYNNPAILICSICLFLLILRSKGCAREFKPIKQVSMLAFAIFFFAHTIYSSFREAQQFRTERCNLCSCSGCAYGNSVCLVFRCCLGTLQKQNRR